jgi:hypothetical protein
LVQRDITIQSKQLSDLVARHGLNGKVLTWRKYAGC